MSIKMRVMTVGVMALSIVTARPRLAVAQVPTAPEPQLVQRAVFSPHEISSLLDLAKLYFDQHRYDDATKTLARAMAIVQREQALAAPVSAARPPAPASATDADKAAAVRVGGVIHAPTRIIGGAPTYPAVALAAKLEGYVIIEALIGTDGRVIDTTVLNKAPIFQDAAVEAVRQWQYEPTLLNGVPVPVLLNVTVTFRLK